MCVRTVARLCVLVGFLGCAGLSSATTIGSSSYLQVNLSFMPFTIYDYTHSADAANQFSTSCPVIDGVHVDIRTCFKTILGNMASQGVSGVRIFVNLCDTSLPILSQAFTSCGEAYTSNSWDPGSNPTQAAWIGHVSDFFGDLRTAGIYNVTITLADDPAVYSELPSDATSPNMQPGLGHNCGNTDDCCPDTPTGIDPATMLPYMIYFSATQPFGVKSMGDGNDIIGNVWDSDASNQGYNCAPINPFFIGWNNEFGAINAMLAKAASNSINVYELETEQELNFGTFTVQGRFMYDNSAPESAGLSSGDTVDVVSDLRSLMTANGFDPGRVNWSSTGSETPSATYNSCTNVYTGYGRNTGPDEMAQAITAGHIGINSDYNMSIAVDYNLMCGGSDTSLMFVLPDSSTQPDIIDVHIYSQATGATNTDVQVQDAAATDFGDLPHFLTIASDTSAAVVIGETWGGTISTAMEGSLYCWAGNYLFPSGTPADNVAGFNGSALSGYTVTFRPWMELEHPSGVCFAYTSSSSNYQNVNYGGDGPYTPTNP